MAALVKTKLITTGITMLPPNLITGKTAKLPGDYVAQPTLKKKPKPSSGSALQDTFARLWLHCGCAAPRCYRIVSEYQFDKTRKWRFDFAFPEELVAIELHGGIWSGGRHVRGKGYQEDREKMNAATAAGWAVLEFTADKLKSDPLGVIEQVQKALGLRGEK